MGQLESSPRDISATTSPNLAELPDDAPKEGLVEKTRSYFVFLLESFLDHQSLNTDIVMGMASFDPYIFLSSPLEQATFCFTALNHSFSLGR